MQYPELVLAGELQNRFEFSQSITPPQLFMNLFSVIRKALPYFPEPGCRSLIPICKWH